MSYARFPYYKQAGWESSAADNVPYLTLTVAFATLVFLVEIYLDHRQMRKFNPKHAQIPERLREVVQAEIFEKSLAYRREAFAFKLYESSFAFATSVLMLLLGYLPWAWDQAAKASRSIVVWVLGYGDLSSWSDYYTECLVTYIFIMIFMLTDTLLTLPFSLYSTFVIEQRHGFNKSTLLLYAQDKLTVLCLSLALSGPILSAVIFLVRWGGDLFYVYVWLFLLCVSILMMTLYPVLIAPLFNKYTPLPPGPTRDAVHALAEQLHFPLTALYSVDGSRRSAHSNAYFFGLPLLGQRIVLYDTLLTQVQNPLHALLHIIQDPLMMSRVVDSSLSFPSSPPPS
ncbi:M48 family peptidase, partial [archaeon]